MDHHSWLRGVFVPLITPFAEDGEVARDALAGLAHRALTEGAAGLVALSTTGETGALSPAERETVTATVAGVCREHGAPLIVGAGPGDTAGAQAALTALGALPQASAALTLVPPFVRPGQAGVVAHFAALAAVSPVPLVVYHVPQRTGQELTAATWDRLATLPNVIGVKYAAPVIDPGGIELMAGRHPGFTVLAGDDHYLSPLLALGAAGGILASAHLATDRFAALVRAWADGDVAAARPLGHGLATLSAALFAEPNPSVLKGVLYAEGHIPTPNVRLPLLPAGAESVATARKALAAVRPATAVS